MVNTSKFAKASYFDCKTVEDFEAYPKVCIISEVIIDKGRQDFRLALPESQGAE